MRGGRAEKKHGGQGAQALGRSRGGFSTKIHLVVDALGNPLRFILTGGECHESPHAPALIEGYSMRVLIGDKGYDAADFIKELIAAGVEAVVPPRVNRLEQREYDAHLYRERHLVECFINKVKHYRRVFSRFEKLSKNYLGFLSFVSALVWLC
jgi:transposase